MYIYIYNNIYNNKYKHTTYRPYSWCLTGVGSRLV